MLIRPCHHIKQCRSRSETHLGDVHASKSMHAITSWQRTVVGRVTCRFDMKLQICKRCFELAKKPSEKIGDLAITTRHSNTLPACVLWWSHPRCLQAPVTPTLDIKPSASGRIADAGVRRLASGGFHKFKRPSKGGGHSKGPGWRADETLGRPLWLDRKCGAGAGTIGGEWP